MNRRKFLAGSAVAGLALAASSTTFIGCNGSDVEGILNTVLQSAEAVLKVAEPGATWVGPFSEAVAALETAEANWKGGNSITVVIDALNTLATVAAAIPYTAAYSPLIDLLVAGIDAVLTSIPQASGAKAFKPNARTGRTSLHKPHLLQTRVGAYKKQWNEIVASNPALADAKLKMNHLLNVIKDLFDERDRTVAPAAPTEDVQVSFRAKVAYIKDQGNAGSCTAHAGTELLEMLFRTQKSELPLTIDRSTLRFSPLFQYAQERLQEGTFAQDAGADSRTIFTVLRNIGCCLETEDPYFDSAIFHQPTPAQADEAAQFKIGAYHRILDVATAKTVLQSGYTFTVGMPLYPQFESDPAAATGLIAMPSGSSIGGHEMHVVGCDDSKQVLGETGALEVQNSWSNTWGDGGFCWIPYRYFDVVAGEWDFWTAHFGKPWMAKP